MRARVSIVARDVDALPKRTLSTDPRNQCASTGLRFNRTILTQHHARSSKTTSQGCAESWLPSRSSARTSDPRRFSHFQSSLHLGPPPRKSSPPVALMRTLFQLSSWFNPLRLHRLHRWTREMATAKEHPSCSSKQPSAAPTKLT